VEPYSLVGALSLRRHLSLKQLVSRFFVIARFCLWGGLAIASQGIGTWHRWREGKKDAGDDLIERSYRTEVSASFEPSRSIDPATQR
jgi:hypothetical protein